MNSELASAVEEKLENNNGQIGIQRQSDNLMAKKGLKANNGRKYNKWKDRTWNLIKQNGVKSCQLSLFH